MVQFKIILIAYFSFLIPSGILESSSGRAFTPYLLAMRNISFFTLASGWKSYNFWLFFSSYLGPIPRSLVIRLINVMKHLPQFMKGFSSSCLPASGFDAANYLIFNLIVRKKVLLGSFERIFRG